MLSDPGYVHRDAVDARLRGLLAEARRRGCVDPCLSDGEQLVLRALLDDPGNPSTEACEVIAPTLWGITGAAADAGGGYPRSWSWLRDLSR
ncbi:MAG: hypothetical protein H6523_13020 [Mycolicibacterium sp.]|nr:hypothetical protein [Mycolicibacterium sp.]